MSLGPSSKRREVSRFYGPQLLTALRGGPRATFAHQGLGFPRPFLTLWNLMSLLIYPKTVQTGSLHLTNNLVIPGQTHGSLIKPMTSSLSPQDLWKCLLFFTRDLGIMWA